MSNLDQSEEERPPIMGTWNNLYVLVIAIYVVMIVLLYFFTEAFS